MQKVKKDAAKYMKYEPGFNGKGINHHKNDPHQ
jgi:hypothetical protein